MRWARDGFLPVLDFPATWMAWSGPGAARGARGLRALECDDEALESLDGDLDLACLGGLLSSRRC
jgi:hypothetical protein